MDQVHDGYADGDLPDRFKLALRLADAVITDPTGISPSEQEALREEFSSEELAELALTVAMAAGFSKAAIAWGPPPPIPVTEIPTPTPTSTVA
ncbi:carboxymuconolactone decarboxylase family protein [Candidatus Poriferisocius sp.]|uniref:carboxymuconolactone decarboxylase family protein n=1 Tax=Candidatus Poriferisocius sp. TaxID=3101276 RepID=UPI003B5ACEBC